MAGTLRLAAAFSCAMILSLAPAVVRAEAGGVQQPQQSTQPKEQPPPEDATEPETVEPKPAGVGSAEQPKDQADGEDGADDQPPPVPSEPGTTEPKPAGVGSAQPPIPDEETESQEPSQAPLPAGGGMAGSGRPFRGLFGGAAPPGGEGQSLDLAASLFGVYVTGESVGGAPTEGDLLDDGTATYGGGGASLTYARNWTTASVGAFGTGSLGYVPDYENQGRDPWVDRWSVGGNGAFNKQVTGRLQVGGGAQVTYSPYYQQNLLFQPGVPTIAPPTVSAPGLDFILERAPSFYTTLHGSVTYQFGPKASLEGRYDHLRRDFVSSDSPDFYNQVASARYRYRFSRWAGLRAGYGYRTAQQGQPEATPLRSHELDIGADAGYGRSFALARRTTFSFNTGTTVFVGRRVDEGVPVDENVPDANADPRSRFVVTGATNLVHAWARTWSAIVGASRSLQYEFGFDQPLLSNVVYASAGGLFSERLDFSAVASYNAGSVGLGGEDSGFATSSATASLRWALLRYLAAYAQYFYYHYRFESGVTLPSFLRPERDRQGVSVGLTTSFALIGSRGRP